MTAPRKPKPIKLDTATARAVRGPHKKDPGRWYWRADLYHPGQRRRETLWTGWGTRDEVRAEVARLMSAERPADAAHAAREAKGSEVLTIRDLLEVHLGAERTRVALWQREEEAGEAAVSRGAATAVRHSASALAPVTWAKKRSEAKQILRKLGEVPLATFGSADATRYAADRLGEAASQSVRNEIVLLRAAWRWGAAQGFLTDTAGVVWPDLVSVPVRDKWTPTREQALRVLAAMPEGWERDLLTCQSILGCRNGALARLRPADVDLNAETVRLKRKSHDRTIRVPREVLDILSKRIKEGGEPTIWGISAKYARTAAAEIRGQTRTAWARACEAVGVPRFTSHAFRRLVSQEWLSAGVDLATYARVLGHSPAEALRHYSSVRGSDELAAFERAAAGGGQRADGRGS